MDKITKFKGEYSFLSNFHPCNVDFESIAYPSSEHCYQASKTIDFPTKLYIRNCLSPGDAKRKGRKLTNVRADWDTKKIDIMYEIVLAKFTQNKDLRLRLIETFPAEIVEENYWGDRFWGVCDGVGENNLGKILMKVRDKLMETCEDKYWSSYYGGRDNGED